MAEKVITMIDKSSPIPAYHQIASDLIDRVNRGEWKIGDKLPPETLLVEEYDVSRVTMRQALSELEGRGIITRQRGRGSFLSMNPTPFTENLNFPSPKSGGKKTDHQQTRILEWKLVNSAPLNVQQMFGLPENQSLIFLSRVFVRNGKPIGLSHIWFPMEMVPDIMARGLVNKSVTDTLNAYYNYRVKRIENYIEAGKMNAEEANILESTYDASALRIISTHYLDDGRPIEFSSTLWVGALTRFRLVVEET